MAEEKQCASASSCSKESCEGCPSAAGNKKTSFLEEANSNSHIKHVIGIVSGKGGVGKSFVTSSLASMMRKAGYKVGILDADITGPSIPKMFGVHGPAVADENGSFPVEAEDGTKIMSINLLLDDEEAPVVWRGPVIAGAVKQFWTDVQWGELDYLFVDMPPGTGDVALTVFQSIPVDGVIIVSTPQDLVKMIVGKAVNMCNQMNIKIIGLVENMSYMECPCCKEKVYPFGDSKLEEVAFHYDILPLQALPINPNYAKLVDEGKIESIDTSFIKDTVDAVKKFGVKHLDRNIVK
jgi:Mrp family chromosome partitioning ATPase